MTAPTEPNAVTVYVKDAVGSVYCHSCSDLRYERSAIEHARWWMRQRRIRHACRPFTLVVERYFDGSKP